MAVQWDKYHVGIYRGLLRIMRGNIDNEGKFNYSSYSNDRTGEIVRCVAAKMKYDLDNRKDGRGYVGYDIPHVGKLILIRQGYRFYVEKK